MQPVKEGGRDALMGTRLSHLSTAMRDENVVEMIGTALQSHNRVLVVYGASHLKFEWQDLVRSYGKPVKKKLLG